MKELPEEIRCKFCGRFKEGCICGVPIKKLKVPCEVYSRVVGYYRPVQSWNAGKQEEFKQRKNYII